MCQVRQTSHPAPLHTSKHDALYGYPPPTARHSFEIVSQELCSLGPGTGKVWAWLKERLVFQNVFPAAGHLLRDVSKERGGAGGVEGGRAGPISSTSSFDSVDRKGHHVLRFAMARVEMFGFTFPARLAGISNYQPPSVAVFLCRSGRVSKRSFDR